MSWYVIEAVVGRDFQVALKLNGAGYNIWRPVDPLHTTRRLGSGSGKRTIKVESRVARFGRYLFCEATLTPSSVEAIKYTDGVRDFLRYRASGTLAELPDELIAMYRNAPPLARSRGIIFAKRSIVKIKEGPFAGFTGEVEDVDRRGVLKVAVSIFGRPTPIIIEQGYVELVVIGKASNQVGGQDGTSRRSNAHVS